MCCKVPLRSRMTNDDQSPACSFKVTVGRWALKRLDDKASACGINFFNVLVHWAISVPEARWKSGAVH